MSVLFPGNVRFLHHVLVDPNTRNMLLEMTAIKGVVVKHMLFIKMRVFAVFFVKNAYCKSE